MDCWGDVTTPEEHLAKSKWILDTFMPWEAARCRAIELTDANGILAGRFAPTVRKPVGVLPSGRRVLGMADAVLLNDPITGQGSNNASKGAAVYLRRILEQGEGPFDAEWMQETFEQLWAYAEKVVGWTNALLLAPAAACAERARRRGAVPRRRAPLRQRVRQPAGLLRLVHGPCQGGRVPRRGGLRVTIPPLLDELLRASAPSGSEEDVMAIVRREASGFASVSTDVHGNTIARVEGRPGGRTVALFAHADEIGMLVTHVHENGLASVAKIANWDAAAAVGKRVEVRGRGGRVPGVVVRVAGGEGEPDLDRPPARHRCSGR